MYNNLSFYKEIKGENVIDIEIYKFADKLLFSSDLKFYLDRFSNFDWTNIFLSEEVFDEENNRIKNIFYMFDIENIKDEDFFEFFKRKEYENFSNPFNI